MRNKSQVSRWNNNRATKMNGHLCLYVCLERELKGLGKES